jgi:hypothetical protein
MSPEMRGREDGASRSPPEAKFPSSTVEKSDHQWVNATGFKSSQHPPVTKRNLSNQQEVTALVDSFLRGSMAAKEQYLSISAREEDSGALERKFVRNWEGEKAEL